MSKSKRIVWIDDNPDRASTARDLGAEFLNVRGKDPAPEVKKLLGGSPPDLVTIDHILDNAATGIHPVFSRGSTIAEAIKEKWPECPVIGVTAVANIATINVRTKRVYDDLFPFHHFSKYFDRINGIATGFASAAKAQTDLDKLIKLLRPPKDECDRLRAALTTDLKKEPDASVPSRMYRWVARLMDRPGFLFDDLWSATFLGLNVSGFEKVGAKFEDAQYTGIFERPDEPRWWSSQLSELLYQHVQPNPGELSWHVGRRWSGIKDHFSSCHCCKKEALPPETVAFLDESPKALQRAMHLEHTVLHPLYQRQLYFEDIRMMREE
jgi:hypothetical protein